VTDQVADVAGSERSTAETVTFVVTDIEGSTRIAAALQERYAALLADHNRLVRGAFGEHGGREIDAAGDGLFYVFPGARTALLGAVAAQRALVAHPWPAEVAVRVRMGLHTGEAVRQEQGFVGFEVNRAARISSAGHGGQVLMSQTTADLLASDLPAGLRLEDRGEHRLKDLARTERLYQAVASDLPSQFPPLRSLDTMPNNLPRQVTSFVGRGPEIERVTRALVGASLVTLTGPGGVGKTRLAVHVAADVLDQFAGGVWLVELARLTDESLVPAAVAATLGVPEQPGRDPMATLTEHVGLRRVLLVLDDCEHVIDATARLADALIRSCQELRILATSREALGIGGEQLLPVPSLSLPDAGLTPSIEALATNDSVRLFLDRATAVSPSFRLDGRTAPAVAQICRRLDGIPLAIELAAARARSMPVDQIASHLDDRFRLLSGGSRTALPRHQTLRAAIAWSHEMLSEAERAVFRRLSVFAGSFGLEAAESVASGGDIDRLDVLDVVSRLVDRSLVAVDDGSTSGYRLLETIREYAREQLVASGEAVETARRHRDWYLELVELARPEFFRGPAPAEWLERLEAEHENLRAALRWSVDEGSAGEGSGGEAALRLASGLWRFWEIRGHLAEGRTWLETAIAMTDGDTSETRARALTGAGIIASAQGDLRAAAAFHEEGLRVTSAGGDEHATSYARNNLANALLQLGDLERSRALYEEVLTVNMASGNWRGEAITRTNLADVADRAGDYARAAELCNEAASLHRSHGDDWGTAFALGQLAQIAHGNGDEAAATEAGAAALTLYRGVGDERGVARSLTFLGGVARSGGDQERALALHVESLAIRRRLGDKAGIATALEHLAAVAGDTDPERAARLQGAADGLREAIGANRSFQAGAERDQRLADLEARLGADGLASGLAAGRSMGLEKAIEEASAVEVA
jgi:predicted ATPase/class 3 adenylate cyclase